MTAVRTGLIVIAYSMDGSYALLRSFGKPGMNCSNWTNGERDVGPIQGPVSRRLPTLAPQPD